MFDVTTPEPSHGPTAWGPVVANSPIDGLPVVWLDCVHHAGYVADRAWAMRELSPAALALGRPCAGCIAYEEDARWAILEHECAQARRWGWARRRAWAVATGTPPLDFCAYTAEVAATVAAWFPHYRV